MLKYCFATVNYTIPSDNRELQPTVALIKPSPYYTIPSDNRELQRKEDYKKILHDYTIPSDNEENQKSILKLRKNRNQPLHYNKKTGNLVNQSFLFLNRKARDGTRTRGPDLGKVVLHQLSHSRIYEIVL